MLVHKRRWYFGMIRLVVVGVCLTQCVGVGVAEELRSTSLVIGTGQGILGAPGIRVPLTLTNTGTPQIASMSIEIAYDPLQLLFQSIQLGTAAGDAGKQVSSSRSASGHIRLVVFGLNRTGIKDGVIAYVTFDIPRQAITGPVALKLITVKASSASGQAVPVISEPGAIQVLKVS